MLDHIFVSELLQPIAQYDIVHINVDYSRVDDNLASDHEPSEVRLNFNKSKDLEDKWEEEGPEECETEI